MLDTAGLDSIRKALLEPAAHLGGFDHALA